MQQKQPSTILAYAAGLFDGEGTVTFCKDGNSYTLRVSMSSTDLKLVTFMRDLFGGSLHLAIDKRQRKPQHQWTIHGDKALNMLSLVRPFMREANKVSRTDIVLGEYALIHGKNKNGRNNELLTQKFEIAKKVRAIR